MMVDEKESVGLPTVISTELAKAIGGALVELNHSYTRTDAEKELQKDIFEKMKKDHGMPRAALNKMAKLYHASSLAAEESKNSEFYDFARAVFTMINVPGIGFSEDDNH